MNLSRNILYTEHRLSHQQIDDLLGENQSKNHLSDKLKQMETLRYFHEITSLLRELNIWFIVLKGPLLSDRIYGDPTYRLMKDFDILVKPESVNSFVELLESKGYEPAVFRWPASARKRQLIHSYMNQFGMYNYQTGAMTEVHWRPFGHSPAPDSLVFKLIEDNLETTTFAGHPFYRFNTEMELAYIVIHGGHHNWFRLKWLVDLNEMLKRRPYDTENFNRIIQQLKAERFADAANTVLKSWFPGGPLLPDQKSGFSYLGFHALKKIEETGNSQAVDSKKSHLMRPLQNVHTKYIEMTLSPRMRYKLSILRRIFFNRDDLNHRWIPPYAIFYHLFFPFSYFYRKVRSEK